MDLKREVQLARESEQPARHEVLKYAIRAQVARSEVEIGAAGGWRRDSLEAKRTQIAEQEFQPHQPRSSLAQRLLDEGQILIEGRRQFEPALGRDQVAAQAGLHQGFR